MDPNTPQGQSNTKSEQKVPEITPKPITALDLTQQVEKLSISQKSNSESGPNSNPNSSPNSSQNFNEPSANPENHLKRQESQNKRKLSNSEPQLKNDSENTSENQENTSKSISQPITKLKTQPTSLSISQNTPKLSTRTRISAGGDPSRFRAPSTLDDELSTDEDGYIDDDEIIIQHRKRKLSIEFPTTDEDESDTDTNPSRYIGHHRSSGLAQLEWDNNVSHNLSQNHENADGVISTSQTFSPVHSTGFNSNGLGKFQQKTKISSKYDGNNNKTGKKAYSNQSTPIKSSANGTSTTCSGSPALSSSQYQLVIVGEQEFRLDMKAIEPYKKVLSHGGYTGASGLTAVVIFTAAQLPDTIQHNAADYEYIMHNIFLYVVSTLDLLVAQDYVLIYLNGACKKRNLPGLSWLRQCYKMIDRRLRKSLKKLLIVHPTFYLRTLITIFRPFVSAKFSRKIQVCRNLEVLDEAMKEVNEQNFVVLDIIEEVKEFDKKLNS